ncbi:MULTISPECIES: hypothetical protein [unclassified Devosia]|uniref:hypothetical protein n=1 Tax=unclassified Devosia TaxID=196773 RepID=UPI001557A63D|nr:MULTISPECIES: hypothetical protein [unclassified Devosia]
MHDDVATPEPAERPLPPVPARQRFGGERLLSFVAGLVAVGAIAASAWVYTDTQRDIRRMSSDIAQIRVSLELFNQQLASPPAAAAASGEDPLVELSNRLAILEEDWRNQSANTPPAGALPPLPDAAPAAATAASGGDCMPAGTRFLVTGGDNYPICGNGAEVNVAAVEAGYVALADGTTIPNGGNALLRGTTCTVAVVSSGAGGMTGYAELRVNC